MARFFQNQTARQIAQAFDISEAAAEKRLTRAVIKLRAIMARKQISLDNMAITALLTGGAGTAPSGLLEKVIQCAGGKAAKSSTAARAARSIAFHNAHVPAIAGTAAVALAVGVAAVVPIAIKARQVPVKPVPAEVAPPLQTAAAHSTTAQSGVLTCVAYEMLVQKDFAWAVRTGGKLISGKPGQIKAYEISASLVRALAWSQTRRLSAFPCPNLQWLPLPHYPHPPRRNTARPPQFGFGEMVMLPGKPDGWIAPDLFFQSSLRPYADFLRVRIAFGRKSSYTSSAGRMSREVPFAYSGNLDIPPGHAVVLLRQIATLQGQRWYGAVVLDAQWYPYRLRGLTDLVNNAFVYLRQGPTKIRQIAALAAAWNRYALAHPSVVPPRDPRWTKSLPGGATVSLQGITTGAWPLCAWTPSGSPFAAPQLQFKYCRPDTAAGFLKLELPAAKVGGFPGNPVTLHRTTSRFQWTTFPARGAAWSVGFDSGNWKIIGTARPVLNLSTFNFFYRGHRFGAEAVAGKLPGTILYNMVCYGGTAANLSDQAIAVGALTRQGKLIGPRPWWPVDSAGFHRFQISRSAAVGEYWNEAIPVAARDVKRYVWITRPRHWVTFHGFALQPSPLPSAVLALQHRQARAITQRHSEKVKPFTHIAANQTTPAGLMALLRRAMHGGNPLALEKLTYAPNSADRHLLAAEAQLNAAQKRYGLWEAAKKRFGVAQMQAAGLGEYVNPPADVDLPKHWKIRGAYATPVLPLPPGASWPEKGQPLHSLIKKHGLWYLDLNLTKAQIGQLNAEMQRSMEVPARNAKAYKAVMQKLQSGKIKDAYALRDALAAALKKYSSPHK